MSYTVLARRYRSADFDQVVGQDHVALTLRRAIESGRIAHAYLFCGTRGTGKTSTARILAKCLNCLSADAPVAKPCGTCSSCAGIARGEDIDVIEIDAASNTGVDNIRELIENSAYRPARSRFKVYIIDEVHMLSKSAFNALLKTLEEPPGHVKFILATTEPEKVLPTIMSRCQRYDFRSIPTRQIALHLKHICAAEKIGADDEALLLVARSGAGSMRDALSLLDRLLSQGEKHLTAEQVEQMLGLPRSQQVLDLAAAIAGGDVRQTLERADALLVAGQSTDGLLGALVDHLRSVLIVKACGPDSTLIEVAGLSVEQLKKHAAEFELVSLTQNIAIVEELRRGLRQGTISRPMIDATLVRLALAEQFTTAQQASAELAGQAAPLKKKPVADRAVAEEAAPSAAVAVASAPVVGPAAKASAAPVADAPVAAAAPVVAAMPSVAAEAAPVAESRSQVVSAEALWPRILELASMQGSGLAGLTGARSGELQGDTLVIRFDPEMSTFAERFSSNGKSEVLREHVSSLVGRPVGVHFLVEASSPGASGTAAGQRAPKAKSAAPAAQVASAAAPAAVVARSLPATPPAGATAPVLAEAPVLVSSSERVVLTDEQRQRLIEQHPLLAELCQRFGATPDSMEEA